MLNKNDKQPDKYPETSWKSAFGENSIGSARLFKRLIFSILSIIFKSKAKSSMLTCEKHQRKMQEIKIFI